MTENPASFRYASQVGKRVLVVDLDGTLLKTDLLWEGLWTGLSQAPWAVLKAIVGSRGNRALLKERLCAAAPLSIADLPFRQDVLDLIRKRREAGHWIVLATASAQELAERVADHLKLFDEVHGSHDGINLKGKRKAAFLAERFGSRGFDYVGDSHADLSVWKISDEAIVVGGSQSAARGLMAHEGPVIRLGRDESLAKAALKAIRPHQWSKNLLVFVPVLAAHNAEISAWLNAALMFVAFCCVASGIYMINDLVDLPSDRAHPRKRLRPFAAGSLPISHGTLLVPFLLLAGVGIGATLGRAALAITLFYILLTISYSFYLKRRIALDICVLAGLYTTRILAGSAATGLASSIWLLGFSVFFFFGLAAVKRLAEIVVNVDGDPGALHGRAYEARDADIIGSMAMSSSFVAVLVFALYLNTDTVVQLYASPAALWLVCPVLLYWTSRTVILAHRGLMHDDPVVFAFRDKLSRICLIILVAIFAIATKANLDPLLERIYDAS